MNIHSYATTGGKDLVMEYLNNLPKREMAEGYYILEILELEGIKYLRYKTNRRQDMGDKI